MRLNAGDTAPKSGQYRVVDEKGRTVNTANVKRGQTLPPTQASGWSYEIDE